MSKRWKANLVLMIVCLSSRETRAQMKMPPETRNAALRYWTAFTHLQDTTGADQATRGLLEKIVIGQAAWDEAKLGHLIDGIRKQSRSCSALQNFQNAIGVLNTAAGCECPLPMTPSRPVRLRG